MIGFGKLERDDRAGELGRRDHVPIYQVWPNYFETVGSRFAPGRFAGTNPATRSS